MSAAAHFARMLGLWNTVWLRPAGARGLVWRGRAGAEITSDHVWCTPQWGAHIVDRDIGALVQLELVHQKRCVGVVQVRELWLPGVYRYWEVLSEPDCHPEISQADSLAALLTFASVNRVDRMRCFSNMARWTDSEILPLLGTGAESFGTYIQRLDVGLGHIRAQLHPEHRRLMTRGQQAGIRVVDGVEASEFQALLDKAYAKTQRRAPYQGRYIYNLVSRPRVPAIVVRAVSTRGTEAVGLCVYGTHRGYYLHGGSLAKPMSGATVLLQLGIMERLIDRGVSYYDFGGARVDTTDERLHGIERFKRRFGGTYVPCIRWEWSRTAAHGMVPFR